MQVVNLCHGYAPNQAIQAAFHASCARWCVATAGVRGGKTLSGTVKFIDRIYRDLADPNVVKRTPIGLQRRRTPRLLYWVVAPDYELGKHVWRYLQSLLADSGLIQHTSQTDYSIWLKPDILIEFKSAEHPNKLVGAAVNGMLLDEACRIKAEAWRGALRSRLTDTNGWAIFTSSPLGGRTNWVYDMLVSKAGNAKSDVEAFTWRTVDNPAIPPGEVDKARDELPPEWFRRDYEGSWDSFGGAIYPEFSDSHILSEKQLRERYGDPQRCFRQVIGAVDWGFTSPACMLAIGQLGENSFVVLEESYAPNRPVSRADATTTWVSEARRLRQKWGCKTFVCDTEDAAANDDMRSHGIDVIGATKNVYKGIRRVAEAIHPINGKPGLLVLDSCKFLIRELRTYQWRSNADQSGFLDEPAGNQSDHSCDALRYGIVHLRPFVKDSTPIYSGYARPIG